MMTISNDLWGVLVFWPLVHFISNLGSYTIQAKHKFRQATFSLKNLGTSLLPRILQVGIFSAGWIIGLFVGGLMGGVVGLTLGSAIAGAIEGYQDETVGVMGWTIGGALAGAIFGTIFWLNHGRTPISVVGWIVIEIFIGFIVGVVIGGISYWQNEVQLKTSPVELLSNQQVLKLCDLQLTPNQKRELSDLLALNNEGELDEYGLQRLDELMEIYDHTLLRKSQAIKVAVIRGLRSPLNYDA